MSEPLPEHIKKLGTAQVRVMMATGQLASIFNQSALDWLAEEDLAASRSNSLINARVMKTARNANTIATAALIVAIACAIIQLFHI